MRWLQLFGLWSCYMSFGLIVASIAPLVATIQADLALSHAAIGSIMGAWQLVYIGAAIPCGMLLDRIGTRWAITLGTLLIALSAFARAAADSYLTLLAAVMLFGLGGPIISSGAPKVVTSAFTGSDRGLAMGIYMTGPTLGGILALTLTHSLLLPFFDASWRAVMSLWACVGGAAALAWFTIATIAGTTPAPADRADTSADLDRPRLGGLLRIPGLPLVLAMSVGVFLINHGLNSWLPELLRSGGLTAQAAGYWAALPMAIGILGSLLIPRLAIPSRRPAILLALCLTAGVASCALMIDHPLVLTGGLLLQGIVRSSLMTVLILTLMELPGLDTRHAGTASGLFFAAAEVGGVLGPLGFGLLYDVTGGFDASLYALAAVAAALALGTLRLFRVARPGAPPFMRG